MHKRNLWKTQRNKRNAMDVWKSLAPRHLPTNIRVGHGLCRCRKPAIGKGEPLLYTKRRFARKGDGVFDAPRVCTAVCAVTRADDIRPYNGIHIPQGPIPTTAA